MGRRATNLTTPVPVLGVPALVGVRGWRTTAADRAGGALLQTWGPQCSVGIQTSPGVSRPPTQHGVQLTDTPSTPSDNITPTPDHHVTKETEHKEVSLLIKSDKEKRAILKLKSGESKPKKEVTFKALGGEASKEVTCSQRNGGGTYCYARAIKTNPHFAGNVTRPKLKSAARYTNGSVVDSEAIGGISVDDDDAEPARSATSRGRNQSRLQGHYAEQSGKTQALSAARPLAVPQKICSHCGGRQSGVVTVAGKSCSADAWLGEKGLTLLSTNAHFQTPHIEKNHQSSPLEIPDSVTNGDKRTHIAVTPQLLHLSEELKYRKTPHPACPVHSKGNLVALSQTQAAKDVTDTQPTTILHSKTITVTKATIETRQDDCSARAFARPSQDGKVPRPTSLTLTPQMATATKANIPHSHTYPYLRMQQRSSTEHAVPQNVSVSVHSAPSPTPNLYTTAAGPTSASITDTDKTTTATKTALTPTEGLSHTVTNGQHHSDHAARVNIATNTLNSPQKALKSTSASPRANAIHLIDKMETTAQPLYAASDAAHKLEEKPSCNIYSKTTLKASFIDTLTDSTRSPTFPTLTHSTIPPLSSAEPKSTLNNHSNSDQIMQTSTRYTSVATQIHLNQTKCSNSEPALHVSMASSNVTPEAAKTLNSRARLLSNASPSSTFTSTCSSTHYENTALRNSSVSLKDSSTTVSTTSSTLGENHMNVCASGETLPQSADPTQHHTYSEEPHRSHQANHKPATGSRSQTNNESGLCSVVANQGSNSAATAAPLSELLNVFYNGSGDAGNPKSTITPNTEPSAEKNKFSGNLINELVLYESKRHENSKLSQVAGLQNYVSLIKSSSSCLQGCVNTEQQRLAHYQGYTATEHEGHSDTAAHETDSHTGRFAVGLAVSHTNIKFESPTDGQTHPSSPAASVRTPPNPESFIFNAHVDPSSSSPAHQSCSSDTSSLPRAHTSPALSFTAPAPFSSKPEAGMHTGPECNPTLPPSTMHPTSSSPPGEAKTVSRPDSLEFSSTRPLPCLQDSSLAHSHPADAALLLPPSPQCCKSAALQQRLQTVEASLAANKDRITTLLNIIHDLETCHSPASG